MSSKCPECGQSLEQDFGVVTCSECASVLFIDMDGNVQFTKSEPAVDDAGFPSVEPELDGSHVQDFGQAQSETIFEPLDHQFEATPFIEPLNLNNEIQAEEGNGLFIDESSRTAEVENLEYAGLESDQEPASNAHVETADEDSFEMIGDSHREEIVVESSPDLNDVSKFANLDQDFGPLSYSVIIENIDTKEVRTQLQEALGDPKFQWDSKALMKEIKMGKLKLEGINPVKVSILVQRLQDLPVKVSWIQHAYS